MRKQRYDRCCGDTRAVWSHYNATYRQANPKNALRKIQARHGYTHGPMRPSRLSSAGTTRPVPAHDVTWHIVLTRRTWTCVHQRCHALRAPWGRRERLAYSQLHHRQTRFKHATLTRSRESYATGVLCNNAHTALAMDRKRCNRGVLRWSAGTWEPSPIYTSQTCPNPLLT